MLKRNLLANYVGQGWAALMGLVFVPLYIKYLGVEAYGLVGLFAMLMAWMSLLDMGMAPTLGREMARFKGGGVSVESIRNLLRSVEVIALGIVVLVVLMMFMASPWLATSWLRPERIPVPVVVEALTIMGLVVGFRFMEGIYRSSILGLQHQVLFNLLNSLMATVRGVGGVVVLAWISPTIQAFFIWQGVVSVATVLVLAMTTYAALPCHGHRARFSSSELNRVCRFAGGMAGITFLGLLLTQADKIVLSKLLNLHDYGYYALAAVVAGGLFALATPITQALFPRLAQLQAKGDLKELVRIYHRGAQLLSVTLGSAAIILIVFSEVLLQMWTRDAVLSERTAPLLSLLALGNLLNTLMWVPYHTQLAYGWTGLVLRTNVFAVLIIVPAMLWVVPRHGAEGAAWVWVALNAAYVLLGAHFMFSKILVGEKRRWYVCDLLLPLVPTVLVVLAIYWSRTFLTEIFGGFFLLIFASVFAVLAAGLSADVVRKELVAMVKIFIHKLKSSSCSS